LREECKLRVFENRVLRRIFGPKRDAVTGSRVKCVIRSLMICSPHPNIVRVIKSRKMRWVGHVARMGSGEVYTGFWSENLKNRDHLENPCVDEKILLKWIFRKWDVGAWTGLIWLRIGIGGGTCECGNETSGSIKCGEFLD